MNIDILHFTTAQWNKLDYKQRKIVYDAQIEKNKMTKKLEQDIESAKLELIANGTARSNMLDLIVNDLTSAYDAEVSDLADVTYDAVFNAASSSSSFSLAREAVQTAYDPVSPDYSLSAIERFRVVREYYMAIEDPSVRYQRFLADSVAEGYLGEYYLTLKNYLYSFV